MDFEQILSHCGSFGYYQILLMSLFGIVNFLSSMHYFTQTIITFTPEHFCYQNRFENFSRSEIIDLHAKRKTKANCHIIYEGNENENENFSNESYLEYEENYKKCEKWVYIYEKGFESVPTELNWVCDAAYKVALGQSFFFVGSVIGTISIGLISDKYGRLPAFLIASLAGGLGDFMTSFTNSVWMFGIARLIAGLSMDTMFYIMYIVVFEYLDSKWRTFGLNIMLTIFYTLGLVLTPWIAIWLGTWRLYLIATSLPILIVLMYPLIICESAQWYLSQNRIEEAVKCLKYVARLNRKNVTENIYNEFENFYKFKSLNTDPKEAKKQNFFELFKKPRLRKIISLLLIRSTIIIISYDVISRNMEGFGTSPFNLFSLSSSVYLPAGITLILIQNKIGRRGTACFALLFGSFFTGLNACFVSLADFELNGLIVMLLTSFCRYASFLAYDADSQHVAELLPTSIRSQTLANVHVIGYAFSFLSSYIIFWGLHFYRPLPMLILSVIMLFGAALCLALPETLGRKLPETLADLEDFGITDKWFEFPCFKRKIKMPNCSITTFRYINRE